MPATQERQYDFDKVFRFVNLLNVGQVPTPNDGCYLTGGLFSNANAAIRYVKIYNKATAATSSDTPVITVQVPANGTIIFEPLMIPFPLGISIRATTGQADADNTAPTANDICVNLYYRG